jgi:Tol biopolymer transport system component/DNA-binding winged helix-turn-helix (wHTH) protein
MGKALLSGAKPSSPRVGRYRADKPNVLKDRLKKSKSPVKTRAMAEQPRPIYEFGPFRIECAERRLLRDGHPVSLTPKAFDVLVLLLEKSGHIVEKDELMEQVWANSFVEESNLKVTISMLRKALAAGGEENRYIETVAKHGYRFVARVRALSEENNEVVVHELMRTSVTIEQEEESVTATARARSNAQYLIGEIKRHRRGLALLLGFAVVAAIALTLYELLASHKSQAVFQVDRVTQLTSTGPIGSAAALSPDGKLFSFSLREGEKESLWIGQVDGGATLRIQPPVSAIFLTATFAPDGRSLYYTMTDSLLPVSEFSSTGALYRVPVFGGAPEKIRDHVRNRITFSPDGKQFAFVRSNTGNSRSALVIANTKDTSEHEIARSQGKREFAWQSPSWSPDGRRIALGVPASDDNATYEVFTVEVEDGTMKPLTAQTWKSIVSMTWRHDGKGLIVIAIDQHSVLRLLWGVSYPDGEARRLISDRNFYNYSVNLSADDHSLLAIESQNQSNIWVAPAGDLSRAKQVTFTSQGQGTGVWMDWTPDGRIVFTERSGESRTIWIMNADGSERQQLIPSGRRNVVPSITGDGRYLVFQSDRSGKTAVWRANLDGSDMRQMTDSGAHPDVSPDGKWIVYDTGDYETSDDDDLGTIYRISIDGSQPERLTQKRAAFPRVSPDSRLIACSYEDEGKTKLAILPIEGGAPLKLFDVPRLANLRYISSWMPDGKAVTYGDWRNGIWKQNLEGGEPYRLPGLPEENFFGYNWSPDGKWFAFTRIVQTSNVLLMSDSR